MKSRTSVTICMIAFIVSMFFASAQAAKSLTLLTVQGAIGPASADYLIRGIEKGQDSELILILLDTPGGLNQSTRDIVQAILNSGPPVVTYVAPKGARAASAGTIILYASTIAAMAPGTHLGAASPVSLTDMGSNEKKDKNEKPSTMNLKVENDALAYIRSLAQLRKRNVDFAEKAITDAATMTASEAKKNNVIDLLADNQKDLLKQLDGMRVEQNMQTITLETAGLVVDEVKPDWRTRFLLIITDPTVAYLLLMLGIYGIFFELINPGVIVPGVIGAIAILLALYALQLLPINYAGLGLIILGISFIIAEAFAPSFGMLGIGGTISFVIGSVLLIDTEVQAYQIAWPAIWAVAVVNILVFITAFSLLVRSRRRDSMNGLHAMIDEEGEALEMLSGEGQVKINGEIWAATSDQPIERGKKVRVSGAEGLTLEVREIKK